MENSNNFIRRTLVERGFRPAQESSSATPSSTSAAITTIARQHQDEQRELQELNAKFSIYLDRVGYLEDCNRKLSTELEHLRRTWGVDGDRLQAAYAPQLQGLRKDLDNAFRDEALQQLQLKRAEYDLWQIQQQIAALDDGGDRQRLDLLAQQLENSNVELDHLKNQFEQRLNDLARQRNTMENLLNELDGLKNELDNHQLERILLENEIQTLREHGAFQDAIHQSQRAEFVTLGTPVLDVSGFYRTELARAISEIREDFEVLSQSQADELEEYYRMKTEQVRSEIAAENERKRLLASQGVVESMDTSGLTSSLKDTNEDLGKLRQENQALQADIDAIVEDLQRIQYENDNERKQYDKDLDQLREEIANKENAISSILENNVSLRFEMSTYRRLLDVEEKHLNRVEEQRASGASQFTNPSSLSSLSTSSGIGSLVTTSPQLARSGAMSDVGTKKMTVQKTARGPISFDSADLETDSLILVNEKYSGNNQSLADWTIHRQVDQQPEIVYQFPSSYSLRPRQTVRILSKNSPQRNYSSGDVLINEKIDSWGQGRKMVTRLLDDRNEEKAIITQVFQ